MQIKIPTSLYVISKEDIFHHKQNAIRKKLINYAHLNVSPMVQCNMYWYFANNGDILVIAYVIFVTLPHWSTRKRCTFILYTVKKNPKQKKHHPTPVKGIIFQMLLYMLKISSPPAIYKYIHQIGITSFKFTKTRLKNTYHANTKVLFLTCSRYHFLLACIHYHIIVSFLDKGNMISVACVNVRPCVHIKNFVCDFIYFM